MNLATLINMNLATLRWRLGLKGEGSDEKGELPVVDGVALQEDWVRVFSFS
jgi:hypothetical protein